VEVGHRTHRAVVLWLPLLHNLRFRGNVSWPFVAVEFKNGSYHNRLAHL
jgi:hypothetical protein